ncbi:MAG: hypothetical protein ACJ74J_05900 [Blastocatellia bacterium]
MLIEAGQRYQCLDENCKCEVTIDKLPTNLGALASFGFGEELDAAQNPKCNFCNSDMQRLES